MMCVWRLFMKLSALTIAITLAVTSASAQQANKGTITKVDEANGTISIQQLSTGSGDLGSADFRVQDGLMFNAVQSGDKVTFTYETMNGAKTITKLTKE